MTLSELQQKALDDLSAYAVSMAGNWRKFESFSWFERPEDADEWCIVYTHNRDSTLIDQSNAAKIAERLAPFEEGDDPGVISERHSHWACGWVEGYAIRCLRAGRATRAIAAWYDLQKKLGDYPILDEDHYCDLQSQATWRNLVEQCRSVYRASETTGKAVSGDDPALALANEVDGYLRSIESQWEYDDPDDMGAFPDDEIVRDALVHCGYIQPEEA